MIMLLLKDDQDFISFMLNINMLEKEKLNWVQINYLSNTL